MTPLAIIADKVRRRHAFAAPPEVTVDSDFADLGFDALDVVEVAMTLEEELGIDLPERITDRWTCVADVLRDVGAAQEELSA